jgi:hypothetical protein
MVTITLIPKKINSSALKHRNSVNIFLIGKVTNFKLNF